MHPGALALCAPMQSAGRGGLRPAGRGTPAVARACVEVDFAGWDRPPEPARVRPRSGRLRCASRPARVAAVRPRPAPPGTGKLRLSWPPSALTPGSEPDARPPSDAQEHRAVGVVQRRADAGERGPGLLPGPGLALRRHRLRRGAHLRRQALHAPRAPRTPLPLAQVPAARPGIRYRRDGADQRAGRRSEPPAAGAGRRLLGRPAHLPGGSTRRKASRPSTPGPPSSSTARPCRSIRAAPAFARASK